MAKPQGGGEPGVVRADKTIVYAQQATLPTNSQTQTGLAAATALPQGAALDTAAEPVEVAQGFGASVTVKATRGKDAEGALALSVLNPPPGLTAAAASIAEKAGEGTVTINTTTDLPLGQVSIALIGKGKLAGEDKTLAAPVVTLSVVKPATVELATAAVEVNAGGSVEVKGKVLRKGAFKEPVTVKLNGLPAGLKAEPATVAADAAEFTLTIAAEEKAAAATASANVALAFQVNKKDYPAPTAPLSVKVLPAK